MKVKIRGGVLNVAEYGARNAHPALVFLHYFGGSLESWRGVIENLRKDFYCIAPDLRGFGASQDVEQNFDLKDYAQNVLDLTETFELENYALVGHSMGAKIALQSAARKSPNLNSLILLAPSPPSPEPMDEDERARLQKTHGTTEAAVETIENASFRELQPEVLTCAISGNLRTAEAAWQAWLENGSRRDISGLCGQITIPVALAVGEKDANITCDLVEREIARRVKISKLIVIGNAGHLLPLEAPNETAEFIRKSIERVKT